MRGFGFAVLLLVLARPAFADGDAAAGAKVFNRCSICHAVTGQNKIGPSLAGVVGRKAGSVAGFHYTKALAESGLTWDEATLDKFLTAPSKLVPGTAMAINLPKAEDRADIIAFLKEHGAP